MEKEGLRLRKRAVVRGRRRRRRRAVAGAGLRARRGAPRCWAR
jgi:hypothetical protein